MRGETRNPSSTTTTSSLLLLLLASVAMVTVVLPDGAAGQADMGQSLSFWNMPEDEQLTFLADYLTTHNDLLKKLLKIADSLQWLEAGTNGNPVGNAGMATALDILPVIFNNSYVKMAFNVVFDELSRAAPTDPVDREALFNATVEQTASSNVTVYSAAFNDTLQQLRTKYMADHVQWIRGLNRFLAQFSARDLLPNDPPDHPDAVNPRCYSDTMDFIDAVVGAIVVTGNMTSLQSVDIQQFQWALKMLDSYGKVSGGILKGAVHYVGSYDLCNEVHAYIPNNSSLLFGQRPHNYVTEYDTRFCRVTFDLPDSVINSFGVDTHGITLRLHWGMCFPDTCHSHDVAAMFHLGTLQQYKISVHSVYCEEEEELEQDPSAIIAIVILALLGGTVVVCTVLEALIQFYNNNCVPQPPPTQQPSAHVAYENAAYQPSEDKGVDSPGTSEKKGGGGGLPTNYVPHKEGGDVGSLPVKPGLPGSGAGAGGDGAVKRSSPPPSYSPRAETGRREGEMTVPALVKAFSVLTNMPKILSGKKSPNAIHCLHGIRFFSMLWILLGHTYNYGIVSVIDNPTTANLVEADAIFKRFTFQAIMAGGFTVDTFFVLSGLLVTYLTLKEMAKGKKGCGYWIMFYVHRFWRLTPMYMVVLMVFCCLHIYLGGGPLWPQVLEAADDCKDSWWTNLLYVNNLVNVDKMCMGWTWYLANDMQFYWISPIFLIPLSLMAPLGVVMVVSLMGMGIALSFYFEHKNGGDLLTMHEDGGYWKEVYIAPWCRVAAYTVGMLLGFVLFRVKRTTLRMPTAVVGWLLTWAVGLFLCYIPYTKNKAGGTEWTVWEYSAYEAFGRPAWAMCVAWIIFACHNNRGGFINSILSWEGFLPVSRLTYAAYLVHPVIMMLHVFSKKALIFIDDYDLAYLYMGHTLTAYLTAFVFSLVAEAPALALERLAFRRH
ncbi:uncharacterized protein LOC143287601 [Babylonia areolata]|uniref:uncharacterized protein LOC143287601 n=1 Tax=Babylonia areolata TaxID=304850 RepID=UPI003FD4C23C